MASNRKTCNGIQLCTAHGCNCGNTTLTVYKHGWIPSFPESRIAGIAEKGCMLWGRDWLGSWLRWGLGLGSGFSCHIHDNHEIRVIWHLTIIVNPKSRCEDMLHTQGHLFWAVPRWRGGLSQMTLGTRLPPPNYTKTKWAPKVLSLLRQQKIMHTVFSIWNKIEALTNIEKMEDLWPG